MSKPTLRRSPYLAMQKQEIRWDDGPILSPQEVFDRTPTRLTNIVLTHTDSKTGVQSIIEEHNNIEVPEHWTELQAQMLATKYCRGRNSQTSPKCESSYKDVFGRIVRKIATSGLRFGYFVSKTEADAFAGRLAYGMTYGLFMFNSPVLFNIGAEEYGRRQSPSACFILSSEDTLASILDNYRVEGRIFQDGSGVGTNLSKLRAKGESLTGGGMSSGPVSFMRGYDASAGSIKSGGGSRRAACIRILDDTHPDILEFIECKVLGEKVAKALMDGGFSSAWNEEHGAYDLSPFQNANHSVRLSDAYMQAYLSGTDWKLTAITDHSKDRVIPAKTLLRKMAEACWASGDPGVQFDDTINTMHTVSNTDRASGSNPCSEFLHSDDTSCNLASITLTQFLKDGKFNLNGFCACCSLLTRAMDILIEQGEFPDPRIDANTRSRRPLGVGFSDLGALLMASGIQYGSSDAFDFTGLVTGWMTATVYHESSFVAEEKGPFSLYAENREPFLAVMEKHAEAFRQRAEKANGSNPLVASVRTGSNPWSVTLENLRLHGSRNSQATVLAPVGTISFLMGNSTTGIEPATSVRTYKKLAGGGTLVLTLPCITDALKTLGYTKKEQESILRYAETNGTLQPCTESGLKPEHLPTFLTAFQSAPGDQVLEPKHHMHMLESVAPMLSGASSKTLNCPNSATVEDIEEMFVDAWKRGIKAVAIYRDGSKGSQVISTAKEKSKETIIEKVIEVREVIVKTPVRERLPNERASVTKKFQVGPADGYVTVGLYPDGRPGEIFIEMSKEGSTLSGLLDAFATAISMGLQYGVPLDAMIKKFSRMRFEPAGFTGEKGIPSASSIIDYIFRWIELRFVPTEKASEEANQMETQVEIPAPVIRALEAIGICTRCGGFDLVPNGKCRVCRNCGESDGACGG